MKTTQGSFEVDEKRVQDEERFDGKWVLRTSMSLPVKDVALKYLSIGQGWS